MSYTFFYGGEKISRALSTPLRPPDYGSGIYIFCWIECSATDLFEDNCWQPEGCIILNLHLVSVKKSLIVLVHVTGRFNSAHVF